MHIGAEAVTLGATLSYVTSKTAKPQMIPRLRDDLTLRFIDGPS